jgi:hypothetical protein
LTLLVLGVVACVLAFGRAPAPAPAEPSGPVVEGHGVFVDESAAEALRSRLSELDRLRADGVVSAAEHKRKRQALLDAWGQP